MRRKMSSCYQKTKEGIIKQEEFALPVNNKFKVTIDSSNVPVLASGVVQIVDDAVITSLNSQFTSFSTIFEKTFSSTLENTLDARTSELENWLNSRFLGGASTSYNSEHMYGIPSDFHVLKFPV